MKSFLSIIFLCGLSLSFATFAKTTYVRGTVLHFFGDPDQLPAEKSYQLIPDGLLIIKDGKIASVTAWDALKNDIPTDKVIYYKKGLILPGFIDTHIHYPQTDMIAANSGGELFQWLKKYTFPFEQKLQNKKYATNVANFFLDEMLRNGTTTAMVFATVYPQAVDAIFELAEKRQMRLISGKTLGDRNLPEHLQENPEKAYQESEELIKKWHNKANTRLQYAVTFRFPPTTSSALFKKMQALKEKYPDTYVHTHISENQKDVNWTKELYGMKNYVALYDKYKLLGRKTLLAHGVHLTTEEFKRIAETKSNIAFAPTSNLFLGSGLFNLSKAQAAKATVGLGTDIGAGTSFSMLKTLNEAYKVLQLQRQNLSALKGLYLATLGGAIALNLENNLGNFKTGKEADFVVLDLEGTTPLLKRRLATASNFMDKLFVLMILGDDRSVIATYVNGKRAYNRHWSAQSEVASARSWAKS